LIDGTVIDATTDTRPKAKLPMNGIIRGWVEGLQLVGEGGEIDLVIPSELAYGDQATTSGIPPGSTLRFQIQLHRILPSGHVN
jgi:FKBP-type peptidyl-prolyl cis-trans isomerase